jgi:hypothetical protein
MSRQRRRKQKSAHKRLRAASVKAARRLRRKITKADKAITRRVSRTLRRADAKILRAVKRVRKQYPKILKRKLKTGKRAGKAAVRRLRVNARKAPRVIRKQLKAYQKAYRKRQQAKERARTRMAIGREIDFGAIRGAQATQAAGDTGGSRPGEPPKMRTGKGRSSIVAELRRKGKYKIESRVYVDKKIAPYMALWEFRPDKKQRPFLKPSVQENLQLLGQVIGQQLRELATAAPRRKAKVT